MRVFLTAAAVLAALVLPGVASALPPANDSFAAATVVSSLPYTDVAPMLEASTEPGEPQFCNFVSRSVWYAYTAPATGFVRADLSGSPSSSVQLSIFRAVGSGIGGLSFLGCPQFFGFTTFPVQAGQTYYIQASALFGYAGSLQVNLNPVPPPANDDFANAAAVGSLPYSDARESQTATIEAGEPTSPPGAFGPLEATTWYAFAPQETGSYLLSSSAPCVWSTVAAYTGDSVDGLTRVASGNARTIFSAQAGTTYRVQVGRGSSQCTGQLSFSVRAAAPISVGFSNSPFDPSSFDNVQFFNNSFDPEGASIAAIRWDIAGTAAEGCCPAHRFGADGNYPVRLDVEMADGRTGTLTRTIQVRTHDVAIVKLAVPQSGAAGQSRSITVGVMNTRYAETVTVRLLKSVAGSGYQQVGALTQEVVVRSGGRTTSFPFAYTFMAADAELGKVTFKAIAEINGARDALPADNEAVGLPTKVTR